MEKIFELAERYRQYVKHYKKNDIIFEDRSKMDTYDIIVSGTVMECFSTMDEVLSTQEFSTLTYYPGDLFGNMTKKEEPLHILKGVAKSKVEVIAIPDDVFYKLIDEDPDVRNLFMTAMFNMYTRVERKYCALACLSPSQRIVEYLCKMQQRSPDDLIHMTIEDIAAALATSRQTVSKAINAIKEDGLLKSEYKVIKILDIPTALKLYKVDLYEEEI